MQCGSKLIAGPLRAVLLVPIFLAVKLHGYTDIDSVSFGTVECPKYYLVGDYACGASILYEHIKNELQLPQLERQMKNPLHAFDRLDAGWVLKAQGEVPVIDGTPTTFTSLDAPLRLKALCKFEERPKFVVTLCDPVARTWTQFKKNARMDMKRRNQSKRTSLSERWGNLANEYELEKEMADVYGKCIKLTLGQLQKCLDIMSPVECGHVLYGDSNPGSGELDALGNKSPCNGVIFGSMYKALLDNWFSVFPQEDFLVLYGDDWIEEQPAVIQEVARHLGVPLKNGDFSSFEIDQLSVDQYWEKDETIVAPRDAQAELQRFFIINNGWQDYINVTGAQDISTAAGRSEAVTYEFLLRSKCGSKESLQIVSTEDVEACQILCGDENGCTAFSFNFISKTCSLLRWCGGSEADPESISGRKAEATTAPSKYRYLPMVMCNDQSLSVLSSYSPKQCEEACTLNPLCRAFCSNTKMECILKTSCRLQENAKSGVLSGILV